MPSPQDPREQRAGEPRAALAHLHAVQSAYWDRYWRLVPVCRSRCGTDHPASLPIAALDLIYGLGEDGAVDLSGDTVGA